MQALAIISLVILSFIAIGCSTGEKNKVEEWSFGKAKKANTLGSGGKKKVSGALRYIDNRID